MGYGWLHNRPTASTQHPTVYIKDAILIYKCLYLNAIKHKHMASITK